MTKREASEKIIKDRGARTLIICKNCPFDGDTCKKQFPSYLECFEIGYQYIKDNPKE